MLITRSRLTQALGSLAATLALAATGLAATAPQASAAGPVCRSAPNSFFACFSLGSPDDGGIGFKVNFHLDVYGIPVQYGTDLATCGRNDPLLFKAQLWGDDGGGSADDYLGVQTVPIASWPRYEVNTLLAFYTFPRVGSGTLNEDPGFQDRDEVYAKFTYVDCHTGLTRTFRTDVLVGDFRPVGGV